jgi:hypothetical protein
MLSSSATTRMSNERKAEAAMDGMANGLDLLAIA